MQREFDIPIYHLTLNWNAKTEISARVNLIRPAATEKSYDDPSGRSSAAATDGSPMRISHQDGIRQLRVLEAVLDSSPKTAWVQVDD